jgi:hypothetical protein
MARRHHTTPSSKQSEVPSFWRYKNTHVGYELELITDCLITADPSQQFDSEVTAASTFLL